MSDTIAKIIGMLADDDAETRCAAAMVLARLRPLDDRAVALGFDDPRRDVQRLVLTHAHLDHAGSAAKVVEQSQARGVTVHVDDAQYVRRGSPPATGSRMMTVLNRLPGTGWTPCPVAATVQDGDVLDVAGGMSVHHTPGHTPGHISLIHQESGVLITGDSIFNMNARMTWPVKVFCTDFPLTKRTAAVLGDLDYRVAAFTHGPQIDTAARETVRGFLRREGVVR